MSIQISISNSIRGYRSVPGGVPVDPDAQAFITAAAITDPTQQAAINTLVVDLKGYSIWTKMKALYPFVGGTATSMKWNLKDPRDLDAAFRLTFHGGGSWDNNGYTPNGSNGWANTYLIADNTLNISSGHLSIYSRSNLNGGYDMGCVTASVGVAENSVISRWTDNKFYANYGLQTYPNVANTDSRGLFIANRNSATNTTGYKNGSKVIDTAQTSSRLSLKIMPIGALNNDGLMQNWSNRQYSFASIGDGLTDAESSNLYTAVQAFQTTLNRSIGTQTVSDADAQAFVTAADIQDQVEANAINNLVIGMKADGLWTKMKAVYPFVGGTASSHKFNLKNPLDTDAAFRLVFSGGWTHSSTGATPNGTNGYANTYFAPNGILAYNNNHLSYYSRTNTTAVYDIGSGDVTGATNLDLFLRRSGDTAGYDSGSFSTNRNTFSNSDSRGFFNGTTVSTNSKYFKNGVNQNTKALSVSSVSSFNMYLGGFNESNISTFYGNKELAFASIGDGLTDTEAANFYTAVQNFNTALARQV
jgi:hypothetical protein